MLVVLIINFFIFIDAINAYRNSWDVRGKCNIVKLNSLETSDIIIESYKAPSNEISRRRNFAIISHPDAGKTTLTEKLLLFGGAIQDAGAVKARADQR
jgi:hypothetical protein